MLDELRWETQNTLKISPYGDFQKLEGREKRGRSPKKKKREERTNE